MTLEQAEKYVLENSSLIGKEFEAGFICGSLWILPIEQKALDDCLRYYTINHVSQPAMLPAGYEGEVGVIAVDVRYLRKGSAFVYEVVAE